MSGNYEFDAPTYGDFGSVVENDNADAWFDNRQEENQAFHEAGELLVVDLPVTNNVVPDQRAEPQDERVEEDGEAEAGGESTSNASALKRNEDTVTLSVESLENAATKESPADIPQMSAEKPVSTCEPSEGCSSVAAQLAVEGMTPAKDEISDKGVDVIDGHPSVSMDVLCVGDNIAEVGADNPITFVGSPDIDVACANEEILQEDVEVQCEAAVEDRVMPLNQQPVEENCSTEEKLSGDADEPSEEKGMVAAPQSEAEGDQIESSEQGQVPANLCGSMSKWRFRNSGEAQAAAVAPVTRRSTAVTRGNNPAGPKHHAMVRKQLANIRAGKRSINVSATADKVFHSPAVKKSKRSGSFYRKNAYEVAQSKSRRTKSPDQLQSKKIEAKQLDAHKPKRVPLVNPRMDQRVKTSDHVSEPYRPVDFIANLRKSSASSPAKPKTTMIQPFKMMTRNNKRKFEESMQSGAVINNPKNVVFKSMAEQLIEFEQRTPQRCHLRSRKDLERGPSPIKVLNVPVTMPMTPQLVTRTRHRSPTCKSSAQLEQEELERIQANQFKARKLDPHLLELGVVPIGSRRSQENFRVATEQRLREREQQRLRREEDEWLQERAMHEFHARRLPTVILHDIVGVPEKVATHLTIPESPAFALKQRVLTRKDFPQEEVSGHRAVPRANPMPHFGLPFQPRPETRTVEPEPFSFDAHDQERAERRQRRLEQMRQQEEQVPQFKALLLPDLDRVVLPEKHVRPPTRQQPFHLRVDERGSVKIDQFNKKLKEEEEQLKEQAIFHAQPCHVTTAAPFVPRRSSRVLASTDNVELNTDRRARERAEYDARLAEQRRQDEAMWEQRNQEEAEAERERNLRLRQELVHKANPVRQYKSLTIHQSDRPITVPHSPRFTRTHWHLLDAQNLL